MKNFGDASSNSAALAQILNKDYAAAVATLKGIKHRDSLTDYLMAVALNRQGNTATAKDYLQKATAANPELAAYAAKDLEFSNYR